LKLKICQIIIQEEPSSDIRHEETEHEVPMKSIKEEITINIHCKVQYIDFEGLSDGKSIKNIITKVGPKKTVTAISPQ